MTRSGREPAEDVKRRIVTACKEVGLVVNKATMHLMKDDGLRIINVDASSSGWPHDTPMLAVMAIVKTCGSWPGTVDIRCTATNENPLLLSSPWMKGRDKVPFTELIEQLVETLAERDQVAALVQSGTPGPYVFPRSVWDSVDPAADHEPS